MEDSKIAGKIKAQIEKFSGILSRKLHKTSNRFIQESLYGIQSRQSVKLTEIARSLEENISLIKTENRLCHQLNRKHLWRQLHRNLLDEVQESGRIKEDSLIIIDTSDIRKEYAKRMENLAWVRDGSTDEVVKGYWLLQVIAAEVEKVDITPIYGELFSQNAPGHESENGVIMDAVDMIRNKLSNKGIWVGDRGFDRMNIFEKLLQRGQKFIIRLRGDRYLVYKGREVIVDDIASRCPMQYSEKVIKEKDREEKIFNIEYGYLKVKIPGNEKTLYMLVIKGFGEKPLMLLTTQELKNTRKSLWNIVASYIRRWQIEDTIRFVKQSYNLEDIRLLTYRRLQNMIGLVTCTMYFACVWMGSNLKLGILVHHALHAAKRLFGIPDFRYYAIADGIKNILIKTKYQICNRNIDDFDDHQLLLLTT